MFFLLVVLLLNYSDSAKDTHSLRLRTQLQRALHTPEYHNISRYTHTQTNWKNMNTFFENVNLLFIFSIENGISFFKVDLLPVCVEFFSFVLL